MLVSLPALGQPKTDKSEPIEAGTILGDFARDYEGAAEKYSGSDITLQGRVEKVHIRKGKDGRTFVTLHVAPREVGSKTMVSIWVDFNAKMADEVGKLKTGDLVQVETSYMTFPPAPIVHEIRGFTGSAVRTLGVDTKLSKLREEAVDWIRKNNAMKPEADGKDNQLVSDMRRKIDVAIARGDDFMITFGSKLMKSKKVTALCVQDGKVLPVEYTDEQAKLLKIGDVEAAFATTPAADMRMPAEVEMTPPTLEGDGKWDLSQPLRGKVKVKDLVDRGMSNKGQYGLRLVTFTGKKRTVFFHSFHGIIATAEFPLRYQALNWEIKELDLPAEAAPRIVFFEVVRRIGPDRFESDKPEPTYEIISEPCAMVLMMSAKK